MLRSLGADEVVVNSDHSYSTDVWRITGKSGVDVVCENVVSGTLHESLRCMAPSGIAVVLGNIDPSPVMIDPGLVIGRRLRISGSGNPTLSDVRRSIELLRLGKVVPQVAEIIPFEEVARAHAIVEDRSTIGRVVLQGWEK